MKLSIVVAKLTSNPKEMGWTQIHEYKPSDEVSLNTKGNVVVVFSVKTDGEEIDVSIERGLIEKFNNYYLQAGTLTSFNNLKDSVEKTYKFFSQNLNGIEIVAMSFVDGVVNCAATGGGQARLLRRGMLATILESDNGSNGRVIAASGYPHLGDIFLIGTKSFFNFFSEGEIKESIENNLNEGVGLLTTQVHSRTDVPNLGMAAIEFREVLTKITADRGSLIKKIASFFPERKIFIKDEESLEVSRNRGVTVSVGIVLLLILLVSIFFGIIQRNKKISKSRYSGKLSSAQHDFEESQSLYSLNPTRARELLVSSKNAVEDLIRNGVKDTNLNLLKKDIEEAKGKILGEYTKEGELYLDLSLIANGFKGSQMVFSEGNIYVFDKDGGRVVQISLDEKKTKVVAGPDQVSGVERIMVYSNRVFILTDEGIYEVGSKKNLVIKKDWTGEVWIQAYTGNIYLLEKETNTIWRFNANGDSFGSKQRWFGVGIAPDLSKTVSWTIDGSIWLLSESGKISKFSRGSSDSFNVNGIDNFSGSVAIYSNEELKYLYILDPQKSRVIVMGKDGEYRAYYLSDKLQEASSLVVSESERKMIILTKEKLYSIELKHL